MDRVILYSCFSFLILMEQSGETKPVGHSWTHLIFQQEKTQPPQPLHGGSSLCLTHLAYNSPALFFLDFQGKYILITLTIVVRLITGQGGGIGRRTGLKIPGG